MKNTSSFVYPVSITQIRNMGRQFRLKIIKGNGYYYAVALENDGQMMAHLNYLKSTSFMVPHYSMWTLELWKRSMTEMTKPIVETEN